jgi:hypothetical protein
LQSSIKAAPNRAAFFLKTKKQALNPNDALAFYASVSIMLVTIAGRFLHASGSASLHRFWSKTGK